MTQIYVRMYMYIYIHIYMHMYIFIYINSWMDKYIYIYILENILMCVYKHTKIYGKLLSNAMFIKKNKHRFGKFH